MYMYALWWSYKPYYKLLIEMHKETNLILYLRQLPLLYHTRKRCRAVCLREEGELKRERERERERE